MTISARSAAPATLRFGLRRLRNRIAEDDVIRLARQHVGAVAFGVADTGHGISAEILPTIFEPFMTHGKRNGTGLGLAISKSVVDAHGGKISVTSSDKGTTFFVDLPLPATEG